MTIDDDREAGRIAGRAWVERNALDLANELAGIEADRAGFDALLAVFTACLDPDGNLSPDDILEDYAAEGRPITENYLKGWIDGAQAAIAALKARPN
jgi:hypothetical protein